MADNPCDRSKPRPMRVESQITLSVDIVHHTLIIRSMENKTVIASIVSANYLAYAKVLAQSLATNDAGELQVLIVDRDTPELRAVAEATGLRFRFAADLNIDNFERLAYKYDIVELNTALKPSFLKKLFEEGATRVIYLDPDIQVFQPLTPVLNALERAQIVVTPHALKPIMDGLRPSDIDYLRTGTFNLGFIGLRKGQDSQNLLDWWESRCLGMGFNDPAFGTFVDQKWMDLAPCYFESLFVLRHPGCNVAYWNLHERDLSNENNAVSVNHQPLIFFHFSGVKADKPSILSRHQTRHQIVAGSPLERLVAHYCVLLLKAGHEDYSRLGYTFGSLDNGVRITSTMRKALIASDIREDRPFESDSSLQKMLRKSGIAPKDSSPPLAAPNTLNFNRHDWRVSCVNRLVVLMSRLIGTERMQMLLRYIALLTREAHFASVLLKRPLKLDHKIRH